MELIAKEVRIGVGEFPPYVIKKGNTGIQLELIKEIFSGTGYTPVFQYLPNSRILKQFKRGKLDIAINVNQGLFKDKFYSDEVVSFNNYAISLKNNNFNIKSIKDLQKLSVLSFQNAKLILACMLHQLVT
ncbi:MAG: hypothetical protein OFPII_20160 [Osedax symbiont Rs1]|nr:MAG: hypothetical protein OFPII_20160 [Osedax symbiont Rs1]